MKRLPLKSKVANKISRSSREVFLRSDFKVLGSYDQVGRVLRQLVADGSLLRVSHGVYAKARLNRITGEPMLSAKGGFTQVAEEALSRLGIKWERSGAALAYQAGSTQIPTQASVVVFGRFERRIGTKNFELQVLRDTRP